VPKFLKIQGGCLYSEPIITSTISTLNGTLGPGLLGVCSWRVVTVSALEGNLSPGLSQISSWCVIQHELGEIPRKE
jgi:hypothetical protein